MRILFVYLSMMIVVAGANAATMCVPDYSTYTDAKCSDFSVDGLKWSAVCGDINVSGVIVRTDIPFTAENSYSGTVDVYSNLVSEVSPGDGVYGLWITSPMVSDYILVNCRTSLFWCYDYNEYFTVKNMVEASFIEFCSTSIYLSSFYKPSATSFSFYVRCAPL